MSKNRKFILTLLFLMQGLLLMGASYILALRGRLAPEWAQLMTSWLPMAGAVCGGFFTADAFITGRALKNGNGGSNGGAT